MMHKNLLVAAAALGLVLLAMPAAAREGYAGNGRPLICDPDDLGDNTPELKACRDWISGVLQPQSKSRCCGEADAYIADSFKFNAKGEYVAVISRDYAAGSGDDGEGGSYELPEIKAGTEIVIPKQRLNKTFDSDDNNPLGKRSAEGSNPTGHGIVFMNAASKPPLIYCYFAPTLAQAPGATQWAAR